MKKQQYSNHQKFYPAHHFVFLPLMVFLTGLGVVKFFNEPVHQLEWILFSIVSFCILYLAIMLRQHYALGNQDRIIRLEFRLRYLELFGTSSKSIEDKLSFAQMAALRFAPDDEFKNLLHQALQQNLSADDIKKSIKNWQVDTMRL